MPNIHAENLTVPDTHTLEVEEVRVLFARNGLTFQLKFDPAQITTLVWDPKVAFHFGIMRQPIQELTPGNAPSSLVLEPLPDPVSRGVDTAIFLNIAPLGDAPNWLRVSNALISQVTLIYAEEKNSNKWYQLDLPVRSTNESINIGDDWPDDAKFNSVDMVYWHVEEAGRYRKGKLAAGEQPNPPFFVKPDGTPHPTLNKHAVKPKPIQSMGIQHSVTGPVCYHYNSCQWVCAGN